MTEVNVIPKPTHRQRQALVTRDLIVNAATDLFLEHGYAATTIDAIAARADVAVSTVYNAFTNKRGILRAIRETWHQRSGQRELYRLASLEPTFTLRLEQAAHATRRQWETSARMMTVYTAAAAVDTEAAAELHEALSGRRENLGRLIRSWAADAQRDPDHAASIFLALTRPEVYLELTGASGWTAEQYEVWLATLLKQQLAY